MYSIVVFVVALALTVQAQNPAPATTRISCSKLTKVPFNFTILQAYSPWDVLYSSDPTYNCTTAMLTGPAPTDGDSYTWVMLQNNTIKNVAACTNFVNGSYNAVRFTTCDEGDIYDYQFLAFTDTYFITFICEPAGNTISLLRGYGHGPSDALAIQNYLTQNQLSSQASVANTGCNASPYCNGFYM